MKRFFVFLSVFFALSVVVTPAMADTTIYMSSRHAPPRYAGMHNRGSYHYSHAVRDRGWERHHHKSVRPVFWPVFYPPVERRVVVEKKIVYVAPQEIPLHAIPTSGNYVNAFGQTCRDYQASASSGTACLQADGAWRVVE